MSSAPTTDDPVDLLSLAVGQFTALAAEVTPEQETLPTPCQSWDVRRLLVHTLEGMGNYAADARGEAHPDPAGAGGNDIAGELRAAGEGMISAWREPGALDRVVQLPFGERPATWRVAQQTVEFTLHSWDLARALGRVAELDPRLVEVALEFGRENLKPQFRGDETSGKAFGAEVPVPADAEPYVRLAGFFGRDPG